MKTPTAASASAKKLDDAARAAWLAHVAGKTQDEIAGIMGVSRQSAQRLVSQAVAAGLVKVRIDHPIARCLDLGERLVSRFGLAACDVVPSLASEEASGLAVAHRTGDLLEEALLAPEPATIGIGTGRTLRAAVEHLPHLDCAQHRVVSLTGNVAPDGSTAFYNVLFSMTDKVTARTFPLPVPVIAASPAERDALLAQTTLASAHRLAAETDTRFIGIGALDHRAPILLDGFIRPEELERLQGKGAVGEIFGFPFDAAGRIIDDDVTSRVCSAALMPPGAHRIVAAAQGRQKVPAIRAALEGGLASALVTDEDTAQALLAR